MGSAAERQEMILTVISVISGAIAFLLTCTGIGTSHWQISRATMTNGQSYISSTANFFYTCTLNQNEEVINCYRRNQNMSIEQYYPIIGASGNANDWNRHLNAAAGLSIIGIILIFSGTVATILMFTNQSLPWIFPVAPAMLFSACLFMLGGLAEGTHVLYYNGYAANLYQTGHLLTIFSFLCSAFVGGLRFDAP